MTSVARRHDLTLEQSIIKEARRLGFVQAGITTPDPPPHRSTFERWLSKGRHGSMRYLETERSRGARADPRQLMSECRSIIVLALPYSNPGRVHKTMESPDDGLRGRVAAYAWGEDYHDVFPSRMEELVVCIQERVGRPVGRRLLTDSAPILERDVAQRAGLGWIGKNTCLIHPRLGSYFLLGEILLDVELTPDAAVETDHCGTCTRCLQACPTSCILEDRTIDARRCISYLTIELRESIPADMRSSIDDWVFGCDICQIVCPWNRFAPEKGDDVLTARGDSHRPLLREQLRLSKGDFDGQFRGTAIRRAKHRGYVRNLAVAAGNRGTREEIASLEIARKHGDGMVNEHVGWAVRKIAAKVSPRA